MNPKGQRILFALVLLGVLFGLGRFAQFRFRSGELFPAYSSLRAEPDGCKALYESLRRIDKGGVSRNYEPLEAIAPGTNTTVIFLGDDPNAFDTSVLISDGNLEQMAKRGARVILAHNAKDSVSAKRGPSPLIMRTPPLPAVTNKANTNLFFTNVAARVSMPNALGYEMKWVDPIHFDTNRLEAVRVPEVKELPERLFWYGHLSVNPVTNEWNIVYTVNDKPVVIARRIGLGSLIVMADSFLFSNEGLHAARSPGFLLWMIGLGRHAIFDETHLGVQRGTGVTVLMREYRLHGLVFGCLLLVCLWIWRNSSPLVPPADSQRVEEAESIEGKTAREGILHLLRRNIPEEEILLVGIQEWAKSNPSKDPEHLKRLEEAVTIAKAFARLPKPRNLASAQHAISHILFPKRT